MRLVFFGSGEFGIPTLRMLLEEHDVALVVSQPDRPAGRRRAPAPTPVAELARARALPLIQPESPADPAAIATCRAAAPEAFVVIAYGHKLPPEILGGVFAMNLHASLLPRYRGAAPIAWAIIRGETETGISIIELAQRMDAGAILARAAIPIDPLETAGELHDRLAAMGPPLVSEVLHSFKAGTVARTPQNERQATFAPKLSKTDGAVSFDQSASAVRCRIHGLTPWPGCTVRVSGRELKLRRVTDLADTDRHVAPGTVLADGTVACAAGRLRILEVQPSGGTPMPLDAYRRGHPWPVGGRVEPG
jgi:methionyl-tRNA formyltransferase